MRFARLTWVVLLALAPLSTALYITPAAAAPEGQMTWGVRRAGSRCVRRSRREVGRSGARRRGAAFGARAEPLALITFCRQLIAGYKVPKRIDLRADPLPKSGPGKVLKRELRAPFWKDKQRGVN